MEAIQAELISLLAVVLTACVGVVTKYVVTFLNKKGVVSQIESNKELVKIVVNAIEQTYHYLDGDEKLELAKRRLVHILKEKNISMSEEELNMIIEAMVKEMNDAIEESK